MEERAVCEAMRTGATQEEIAQRLATTRKSVEPLGQLGGDPVTGPLDLRSPSR